MEGFVFVSAVGAGEDGCLGVHGFTVFFGFFDFFGDFLVVFAVEDASRNDKGADEDEDYGEDGFPGDFVGEDALGGEE